MPDAWSTDQYGKARLADLAGPNGKQQAGITEQRAVTGTRIGKLDRTCGSAATLTSEAEMREFLSAGVIGSRAKLRRRVHAAPVPFRLSRPTRNRRYRQTAHRRHRGNATGRIDVEARPGYADTVAAFGACDHRRGVHLASTVDGASVYVCKGET